LNVASQSHQTKALTPAQARQLEPELSLEIVGALFSPHDGEINPIKLVFHLTHNAKKCGVKFLTQTPVIHITHDEVGVTGVDVRQGFLSARNVVVAAGTGSALLVQSLGVEIPQVFERGQILVTEAIRRVLVYPTGISRQTIRGNILLGTTYEANCGERLTTAEGAKKIANDSIHRYPALKEAQIVRHFAGIRPLPKDGLPYLGAVKRIPGLFIATSHSGITLAPVHGKVISELIIDGITDVPVRAYSPERYCSEPALNV
jgi:glycine/D-amino acid oxidase-like deaminating enzyme